jgi:hypothetical protein
MGAQLADLSFEEWIGYAFDHPVSNPQWFRDMDRDYWHELGDPAVTVAYLTRAFETADAVFAPFTEAQLNQGLWYLADNSCSNHMFALLDPVVPQAARVRAIRSMFQLFAHLFLRRCDRDHLSHLDTGNHRCGNPLNGVCYMWWDILPIYGRPEEPDQREVDEACLEVMRQTLDLDADACRESALHGLGHWHHTYPLRVAPIIEDFLRRHDRAGGRRHRGRSRPAGRALRPELRAYALRAQQGCVL